MRFEQRVTDGREGLKLAELEALVQAARAHGATGNEVVKGRAFARGGLRAVSIEVTERRPGLKLRDLRDDRADEAGVRLGKEDRQ